MDRLRKFLMIISLSGIGIVAAMLILQVLGVNMFVGIQLRIMLIIATLAVASGIAISEVSVIKRKKILGYVGLGLLTLSVAFAIVIFSTNILVTESIFNRITGITALNSVLFIIFISLYSKLGKSFIAMQIPAYLSLTGIDVVLSLTIAGVNVFGLPGMVSVFIILCIIAVALLIATAVVSSKIKNTEHISSKVEMVTIPKMEYENLKKENEELKAKIEELENK